jgi:hypothetical protein
MNYYPKYLSLLNKNMVGGAVDASLYNSGTILNAIMTWNIQYNRFLKLPSMLQLVKLSKETIKNKIIKDEPKRDIFYNLLLIAIDDHEQYFKDRYPNLFDKYLSDNYLHDEPRGISGKNHVIYVKNLINFFIETHKTIDQLLAINNQQLDEETAKDVQKFLGISRDYYYDWRKNLNKYYGEKDYMGLPPRDKADGSKENFPPQADPDKAASLYTFLTSKDVLKIINAEYNELPGNSIISYLKIRLDADELDAKIYNHRFNVFLEDLALKGKNRLNSNQSMYLTGPKPYHNIYYYPKNKKDASLIPTLKELRENTDPKKFTSYDVTDYADLTLDKETGDVNFVNKYHYGNLYGPFTRIFKPQENNNEVSKDCVEILNQLKDNKSVFILGYGGSGAGKTSALVYYKKGKKGEKEGILLNILKNKELGDMKKITVSFHELYGDVDTPENEKKSRNYNNIVFEKDDRTGEYNIHSDTLNRKVSIEGEYTEKVRTQISDAQYDELKIKTIQNLIAQEQHMNGSIETTQEAINRMPEPRSGKPKPVAESYEYKVGTRTFYLKIGYKGYFDEAIDKIENIVWTETIYKWIIIDNGTGKIVFTGKDTIKENITDIEKKIARATPGSTEFDNLNILKEKYTAMREAGQKIYDPRLLCIADKDDSNKLDDEDKDLCDPAEWKGKPIQVSNLGVFLLTISDRIRMINPTTNNPVSSRSHGLIYIKLPFVENGIVSTTQFKYFCVGDLAGVEDQFTCSSPDTQSAFLNLDYIDRITGQAIKGPAILDEKGNQVIGADNKIVYQKIPHYTTNTKLSWTNLPNDLMSRNILNFLGYNPISRNIEDASEYSKKLGLLRVLSRRFNMFIGTELTSPFKEDFGNAGVDPNEIFIEFLKQPFASRLDLDRIMKTTRDKFSTSGLSHSATVTPLRELYTFITNNTVTATGNEDIFFQVIGTPSVIRFYEGLQRYKASLRIPPPQGTLTQEQIATELKKLNEEVTIPENVRTSIKQFYIRKYPGFIEIINNVDTEQNAFLLFGNDKTKGLIQKLEDNLSIFKKSGVQQLCNDRMYEGKFINQALIGMSKSISLLIQDLNASGDKGDRGLVKNIPLVKEPCFKFFCDREHETCFDQYVKDNVTKYNDAILSDIKEMIGDQINNLKIAIFAVLNINRKASDYQKVPYIEINKLKYLRNQYITNAHFLQENNKIFRESLTKDIKTVLFGNGDPGNPDKDSVFNIINRFESNIGATLSQAPRKIYEKFGNPESNFFKILVELIDSIDIINSLSYIGTMDFLNTVNNIYSTDTVCKLDSDMSKKDYSEPIESYINAVTGEKLFTVLSKQANPGKVDSNIQMRGLPLETAKLPKTEGKSKSSRGSVDAELDAANTGLKDGWTAERDSSKNIFYIQRDAGNKMISPPQKARPANMGLMSIDSILGGYIDSRSSYINQKDELINEHNQLKKIYRRLKNNVI